MLSSFDKESITDDQRGTNRLKQNAMLGALFVHAGRESFHSGLIGGCRLIDRARNDVTKVGGRKVFQTKDITKEEHDHAKIDTFLGSRPHVGVHIRIGRG